MASGGIGNINPKPNPAFSAGENFGNTLWQGAGNLLSGAYNFGKGLLYAPIQNAATDRLKELPDYNVLQNQNTYTLNGKSYNAAGDPSSAPVTSAINYTAPSGGTDSSGTAPSTQGTPNTQDPALANTYSGGVNAYGNKLPGFGTSSSDPFSASTQGLISSGTTAPSSYTAAQQGMSQAQQGLLSSIPSQSLAVQNATNNIQNLQNQYATQQGIIGNSPIGLSEQGGEQGLLNEQYAGKLAAAQTALQNALTGNQQLQSAYTGAGNIAAQGAGAATAEQQAQQSALAQSGALTQPTPADIYGFYQPGTGQYESYPGGAAGAAQVQGALNLGTQYYSTMKPAYENALGIVNGTQDNPGLMNFLKSNPDINGSQLNSVNFANQWLNNQFSSSKYQALGRYLTELLNTLTPVVGAQGVSNYKQQLVNSMVNPTASNQSIQQQIQQLMSIAGGKMQTTYQSFAGGNQTGNTNGTTNTGSTIFGSFFGGQ